MSRKTKLQAQYCANPDCFNLREDDLRGLCLKCLRPDREPGRRRGSDRWRPKQHPDGTATILLVNNASCDPRRTRSQAVVEQPVQRFAIIDAAALLDVPGLACCKAWCAKTDSHTTYAQCLRSGPDCGDLWRKYLHRVIAAHYLGAPPEGMTVDHVNGDGLNNRIENLQYLTDAEQAAKRKNPPRRLPLSKYRGVYSRGEGWQAILKGFDDEDRPIVIYLDWYETQESAAQAVDFAGLMTFGRKWAHFNINRFPELNEFRDGASWWQPPMPT